MTDETTQAATPAEVVTTTPDAPVTEAPETKTETTDQAATDTATEKDAEQAGEAEGEGKKKPSGSQRLKRRLALIEGEFDRIARENEELKRVAPRADGKLEGEPGVDRPPTESDFPGDYFAFERANTVWATRKAVREEINRDKGSKQDAVRRELQSERLEAYEEYAEAVRERIPDFDKVVRAAADVTVKPEVVEELLASDKSALLQYHLAKNPDKVRELNSMTGRELAREIGRLESRVHLPTPKKATDASPPPSQVRGGAAPAFDPHKTDDMEKFASWLKNDLKRRSGRS